MNYKSQTVTAVVITLNNAATLERALSSLHFTDELVVLDRGSTDGTLAIARNFTDKVYFHPSSHPTVLRRDALSAAGCDWVLLIEPDEWVEEMLRHEIDGVMLNSNPDVHGYTVPRQLKFLGEWLEYQEPERLLRLVHKNHWQVSEDWQAEIRVDGAIGQLDRPLGYAPYATVADLFADANGKSTLAAYQRLEARGVSAWDQHPLHIIGQAKWAVFRAYLFQGGIQAGFTGLVMAVAAYIETFLTFCKVRQLSRKGS